MINSKIIKIASNTRFNELFNEFTHKSNIKNKKCGDTITIELIVKKNIIISMRYETESCIFCQASASILASKINLFKIKDLKKDLKTLSDFTVDKKFVFPKKFNLYKVLLNNKNIGRFDCIMLPFKGLTKALNI